MLCRPTHPTTNHSPAPDHGPEPQKEAVEKGHGGSSYRAPRQLHPQTPVAPQPAGHPHPRMAHHGPPSSPAGQPLHQSGDTSQSTPAKTPLLEPGTPPPPAGRPGPKARGRDEPSSKQANPTPVRGGEARRKCRAQRHPPCRTHTWRSEPPRTGPPPQHHSTPPKTKQCPQPSKANHPSPPQKEAYTHPNIRTTPRAHKTLDTQVDPAPPPPADPPPRQQNVLLEGRSTCNEMGPTRQFWRPLCPPIHQRSPSQGRAHGNAPAQNPGDMLARTQDPQGPAKTPAREAIGPRVPKPTPDPPMSSTGTRPVTYVHSPQCQTPCDPSPGSPQMPQPRHPPNLPQCPTG
ncbi:pollen-specific leucine-rich repeat extensin-like protein 3 [Girardinichthys multiradiatus]|uniref:pollen-specific leucine-rich repeat extensin-like protein 3 n=1 Tax=Girardinichthys multiradiatus TaxID=208333 RepID=UPI001FABB328|nr:pollen-specific leucine-rich repeat extensin-like protein 3 [Girardinichthys multiradiatus]